MSIVECKITTLPDTNFIEETMKEGVYQYQRIPV